jgi:hypothetical protein
VDRVTEPFRDVSFDPETIRMTTDVCDKAQKSLYDRDQPHFATPHLIPEPIRNGPKPDACRSGTWSLHGQLGARWC